MEIEVKEKDDKDTCVVFDESILGYDFFGNPIKEGDIVISPFRPNTLDKAILCVGKIQEYESISGIIKVQLPSGVVNRTPNNLIKIKVIGTNQKKKDKGI